MNRQEWMKGDRIPRCEICGHQICSVFKVVETRCIECILKLQNGWNPEEKRLHTRQQAQDDNQQP